MSTPATVTIGFADIERFEAAISKLNEQLSRVKTLQQRTATQRAAPQRQVVSSGATVRTAADPRTLRLQQLATAATAENTRALAAVERTNRALANRMSRSLSVAAVGAAGVNSRWASNPAVTGALASLTKDALPLSRFATLFSPKGELDSLKAAISKQVLKQKLVGRMKDAFEFAGATTLKDLSPYSGSMFERLKAWEADKNKLVKEQLNIEALKMFPAAIKRFAAGVALFAAGAAGFSKAVSETQKLVDPRGDTWLGVKQTASKGLKSVASGDYSRWWSPVTHIARGLESTDTFGGDDELTAMLKRNSQRFNKLWEDFNEAKDTIGKTQKELEDRFLLSKGFTDADKMAKAMEDRLYELYEGFNANEGRDKSYIEEAASVIKDYEKAFEINVRRVKEEAELRETYNRLKAQSIEAEQNWLEATKRAEALRNEAAKMETLALKAEGLEARAGLVASLKEILRSSYTEKNRNALVLADALSSLGIAPTAENTPSQLRLLAERTTKRLETERDPQSRESLRRALDNIVIAFSSIKSLQNPVSAQSWGSYSQNPVGLQSVGGNASYLYRDFQPYTITQSREAHFVTLINTAKAQERAILSVNDGVRSIDKTLINAIAGLESN